MSDARPIIVELLRNIGGRKEVEQYLRHYCSVDSQKFAVIVLGDDVMGEPDVVAAALSFLHQVGLCPIVVHVGGASLTIAQHSNLALVEALEKQGCQARPIAAGVFETDDDAAVTKVDVTALSAAVRARQLPIVASLGTTAGGQIHPVDPHHAGVALARRIEPHKLVLLNKRGGILDERGDVLSAVNLSEDADALFSSTWLDTGDRTILEALKPLLDALPSTTSVSITSPTHLARELFTHRGAGTLVRRGERVLRHESFDDIDAGRLRGLLESCFGRTLADDYFKTKTCGQLYVTENYRATAIVTEEAEMPYLDKFAVTQKAQGEGLGGSVWSRMRSDHERLFWRSRSDNLINGWYFQQADGSYKRDQWTVFWYGLDGFDRVERCVETALALPATFGDHGTDDG
jgi:acetylglutamate synthase